MLTHEGRMIIRPYAFIGTARSHLQTITIAAIWDNNGALAGLSPDFLSVSLSPCLPVSVLRGLVFEWGYPSFSAN
jgi:hypothetical protein